jgi:hypothetical protein
VQQCALDEFEHDIGFARRGDAPRERPGDVGAADERADLPLAGLLERPVAVLYRGGLLGVDDCRTATSCRKRFPGSWRSGARCRREASRRRVARRSREEPSCGGPKGKVRQGLQSAGATHAGYHAAQREGRDDPIDACDSEQGISPA